MTAEAISTAQRNRLGPVYIRQSSPQQVARNLESQRRQRGFVNRAVELGWAANRIRVIDEDLGQSGARSGNRQGFQQTVTMAALGRIGIILALEDPAAQETADTQGPLLHGLSRGQRAPQTRDRAGAAGALARARCLHYTAEQAAELLGAPQPRRASRYGSIINDACFRYG